VQLPSILLPTDLCMHGYAKQAANGMVTPTWFARCKQLCRRQLSVALQMDRQQRAGHLDCFNHYLSVNHVAFIARIQQYWALVSVAQLLLCGVLCSALHGWQAVLVQLVSVMRGWHTARCPPGLRSDGGFLPGVGMLVLKRSSGVGSGTATAGLIDGVRVM
jgi:hypothetical protein